MRATIDVKDKKDREAIKRAMQDPLIYATTVVCGHLLSLPSKRARQRVLSFVADQLDEESYIGEPPSTQTEKEIQ